MKNSIVKRIAAERIKILYSLAKEAGNSDPELSKSYAKLIKQISRHYKIRLDKDVKRHICKKCGSVLIHGKNLSVKIASSKRAIIYRCMDCGHESKIIY